MSNTPRATLQQNTRLIDFPSLGDVRGQLCALESMSAYVPFDIKRVYYMWDVGADQVRGKHAHYTLKQVLICLGGACEVVVDDGRQRQTVRLDSPLKGLLIDGFIWREMQHFTPGATLMVLASAHYDEADYVRNYDQFLQQANEG